jgi:hypothetical protein
VVEDYGEISPPASDAPRIKDAIKKKALLEKDPFPDNGWIVDSEWSNSSANPISYFSTEWVVPPVPASDDGQLIYIFNGLTPSDNSYILQPVLQWGVNGQGLGGNYWAIANWYVPNPTTNASAPLFVSTLVQVNAGDSLQGIMTLTGQSGGTFNYSSVFAGYATADLNLTDIQEQTIAYETLECYGITQASDYPNTLMTAMTNIEIKLGSTEASIDWTPQNTVTDNGQQCIIVSNASPGGDVYLFYATDAQNFYFVVNKSSFGTDEVKDVIAGAAGGRFYNSFFLMLDGFTPNWIAAANPTFALLSTFNSTNVSGLSISQDAATPVEYELGGPGSAYGDVIQRIRFAYDVRFTNVTSFPAIGSEQKYTLLANISVGGTPLSLQPETIFQLVGGSDPYFTNVDPSNPKSVFYLSQDLRVFTVTVGQSPISGAPAFTSDPYGSIQTFLYHLNHTPLYTQPYPALGSDPLNALPNQSGYETGDISVSPLNGGQQNYNFALARVRLQGAGGTTAPNVRVFFRLWVAVSCDTDFQPSTTYFSNLGTTGPDTGFPIFPVASAGGLTDPSGQTLQTIPFFATNSGGSNDYNSAYVPPSPDESNNIQTITIPAGQDGLFTYFGCFLDVYNSSNQSKFPGSHHCIVAQIAYDDAPIPTTTPTGATASPENWDKLAQRNLQITSSGNPGFPVTHRIPQTFDARPSPLPIFQSDGQLLNRPDELMIDWGNTPLGSVANVYWPQVSSAQVLKIASSLYATHCLSAVDSNTIQCTVTGGVTYIPIPNGPGQNFAGLFTVDLPNGIHVGDEFNVIVRRITARQSSPALERASSGGDQKRLLNWRCIAGTFQVKIPVSHEPALLIPEENLLAILKWRLENMSSAYRWYPVVQRYIAYVSARVKGMGGHPSTIVPSQYGVLPPVVAPGGKHRSEEEKEFTGKVSAITYDRFGDFDGFLLLTREGKKHFFRASEHEIEEIVNRAWAERILVSVIVERGNQHVPISIVLRRLPRPYHG